MGLPTGGWRILGHATTRATDAELASGDPRAQARAIRRALAAAGRLARDVDVLVIAGPVSAGSSESLERIARRALGRPGANAPVLPIVLPVGSTPSAAMSLLLETVDTDVAAAGSRLAVIALTDAQGTTVAICGGRDGT